MDDYFLNLTAAQRRTFAAGVVAQVVECVYGAWQRHQVMSTAEVVLAVRAGWESAPREHVHGALARLERAGILRALDTDAGTSWTVTEIGQRRHGGFAPSPRQCAADSCERLHHDAGEHLPAAEESAEVEAVTEGSVSLVLRHADYAVTWQFGAQHACVWFATADWDNFPDEVVAVIATSGRPFTAQALAELTASWLELNPDVLTVERARRRAEQHD